ncbi:MAG: hypothetical protein A3F95_02185 [Candidatus Nealsonbacteria bacterium RIFCSPLOWO2_12_FULL_39_31]|uniref:FAD-binding FR-type domain-containing protein n=3 Tax=Candidatus Nealsoniibacteriota TaxID=1817911 RepID=A0A1G2EKE1_9BACT|nr:MAG: Oxidoreductase FAD/NAD(P)-binding domain protein [Parcubacteria group bacterium GW2011_GWA2_38_27]OGZ20310.1 MAG: hypothetical protein A2626_00250 [Candidatus Nealsonbacteria bacterium RIFCSPHIGHO2_01_FULL_38_55]OGZ20751.1 MAG: hypothetical protein A2W55_00115 [Candidatus Nealsonbacteria bacterium RIFCSPHIGHO2_02_38_10]OGZ20942.1 MAG: hypothetical protein A3C48_03170 [Candidatus Nealsonbacteria bacterium RIFCSPHIGHO2_02_FULL_38_75]OGZ22855.1 MAG: hypothetical protein A3E18_00225 [Candid
MRTRNKARLVLEVLRVFLIFSFFIFIRSIFGFDNLQNLNFNSILYLLGKLAGLVGFLFLSLLIFSGDTARFFDKFFGMDKIIKFQRKFALFTIIFVLAHPIFFALSSKSILPYIMPDFSVIPLALGTISLYIFIIVMIASKIYKRISYNIWQYIHLLTYFLFFFSLYHAVNWGSDYRLMPVKIIYGITLMFLLVGIIYRTFYKIKQKYAGKFYVQEIKTETKDTFTLVLKSEKAFSFKAGQFCFLRLNKDKLYTRNPFTISSSPKEATMCFTVKLEGRFTKTLSELKKGEEVIIDGPFGIFTIEDEQKNLVFIAGGVGITPFMSMIKDKTIADNQIQNIILLYGSRTKEEIICKEWLDSIKKDWFKKAYVLSNNHSFSGIYKYETGHINKEIIKKYVENIDNSMFYICGPEIMKNNLKKILNKLGVNKQNIMIEDFFW